MGEWTAKRAAILGIVCSGTFVAFMFASAVAMQHGSGAKDWGTVFGFAFGVAASVLFLAALLSFFVSVSLIIYKRFFGVQQVSPATLPAVSKPPRQTARHLAIVVGFAVLIASPKFGPAILFFVGIPAMIVAFGIAGGARSPTQIPLRDAILYVGISVAIVFGIFVYVMFRH